MLAGKSYRFQLVQVRHNVLDNLTGLVAKQEERLAGVLNLRYDESMAHLMSLVTKSLRSRSRLAEYSLSWGPAFRAYGGRVLSWASPAWCWELAVVQAY